MFPESRLRLCIWTYLAIYYGIKTKKDKRKKEPKRLLEILEKYFMMITKNMRLIRYITNRSERFKKSIILHSNINIREIETKTENEL